MSQKKKNAAKVSANAVAATALALGVLDEIQAAILSTALNAIKGHRCGCVLSAGIDTQDGRISCEIYGCRLKEDNWAEVLDQRQKEIEYFKNNEDWQLAAPLGELMLIAPEINTLLMKALEERGVKPTPYHIHTLATLIQQLSGAAL